VTQPFRQLFWFAFHCRGRPVPFGPVSVETPSSAKTGRSWASHFHFPLMGQSRMDTQGRLLQRTQVRVALASRRRRLALLRKTEKKRFDLGQPGECGGQFQCSAPTRGRAPARCESAFVRV
jgi:hypothetical protein